MNHEEAKILHRKLVIHSTFEAVSLKTIEKGIGLFFAARGLIERGGRIERNRCDSGDFVELDFEKLDSYDLKTLLEAESECSDAQVQFRLGWMYDAGKGGR